MNSNAAEDDDQRYRAAASTRPDTHDHTLDRTPRHSLDGVADDPNGRPGRRRAARLPAVSNRRRLLLSPLWLLIALATMLGLNASSAAAGGGLETRVRAFEHVTIGSVGQQSSERPASVGCLRPSQPAIVSGSCVATNNDALISGILRDATAGKGNFGLGSASEAISNAAGEAWVGPGYRVSSGGKAWVSADGLRQFRPASYKPNLSKTQSNFESRLEPSGQWQSNGHLDIVGGPGAC